MAVIPATYEEWRHYITVLCRITLTPEYIQQRLRALHNSSDRMTTRFREVHGEEHLNRVIAGSSRLLLNSAANDRRFSLHRRRRLGVAAPGDPARC